MKDSGKRMEFESGMVRDVTEGKTRWDLVADGPMLERWAAHLTKGAEKYTPRNWMLANGAPEYDRFRESAFRHFMQWYYGHTDEDHAAAVFFNINGAEYSRVERKVIDPEYHEILKEDLAYAQKRIEDLLKAAEAHDNFSIVIRPNTTDEDGGW